MPIQLPRVQLTEVFRQALVGAGVPADAFAASFSSWKAAGTSGRLKDPYFGKDGPYLRPLRGGKAVLWHVHIRPENNPTESLEWDNKTRAGLPKTSDAVLIYTYAPSHGYLLLHAIWDKGAHNFGNMSTALAAQLMNDFAETAEEFIFWGKVTA